MEKVKTMKKERNWMEVFTNQKVKYGMGTLLLSGIGIALPRIFHLLAGDSAGATFLPMHIAVLIATLVFGLLSGSIVAGSSVMASYLLTGMPTLARLPYMLMELVIYVILLSIFNKKFSTYVALIGTIVLGRVLYAGVLFVAVYGFGLPTYGISVLQSIEMGLPGIVIQLVCVPGVAHIIQKGIHLDD